MELDNLSKEELDALWEDIDQKVQQAKEVVQQLRNQRTDVFLELTKRHNEDSSK